MELRYIEGLIKIILTICAFGVLTMLSFRDEQILDHRGSTTAQIPLIQAAASPARFTVLVPIVIFIFQTCPRCNFDDMNLREADLRKFKLKTASFQRAITR